MLQTPEEYNTMLNRLTGQGTYESFDMRCMVTGQFAVGKSSLVKLLVGDVIPEGRHPTDGISLHEGRCGLDVQTREWILIDPETYNAMDVVYNKVLMTSNEEMEPNPKEKLDQQQASDTSPSGSKDDDMVNPGVLQQSQAMALPLPLNTSDNLSKQPPAALTLSPQASSIVPLSRQQLKQKMKAKMTKDEIRIKMEKVLKKWQI
ncbi:RAB5C [Mytilus coruscus]|uniref:RAB5C n=1 Tax=Mytilus coruscus TaxID=42192 RepID=A0A6J8A123_MYTCO|nr:RAB5C [Mytilus coruscus]